MSNIIKVDFRDQYTQKTCSADVYSHDMKKYQFQAQADSIADAYRIFVSEAANYGVQVIKCIAIYKGGINERKQAQPPERVWYQKRQTLENCV